MQRKFNAASEVGTLEREQLEAAAAKSNQALAKAGPARALAAFLHRTLCVYLAEDERAIREHAEISGFPATRIVEISKVIDPSTARDPGGVT